MSLPSPSALALSVSLSVASLLAAAAHRPPRWTSPWAPPSLPTMMMPSALSSLRPRPMTKTRTSARQWHLKACLSAHSRTVLVNPPQPLCCCHCAAAVTMCATAALRTAATAANPAATAPAMPPLNCRQRPAVALPPPPLTLPLPPRCCRHAVHRRRALRCRHRH